MEENDKKYYALHAVIFKKPYDIEKAQEEVNNYIKDKKKHFYRETKASYRFRNLPKSKFIKKTFKTKNLKNGVSLIMGELKGENKHLEGGGIFDLFKKPIQKVKEFFSPRTTYNNTTEKNLKMYGNLIVQRLTIARTPILSILDKVVNFISLGKWSSLKKEYGFDKIFHLALIANLGTKNLVIEKNEVINVDTNYKMSKETETLDVPLNGKSFTVNQMLDETRKRIGDKEFIGYNAFSYNCQAFVKELLTTEGLYNEQEKEFLFQDVSELAKKMPAFSKKIMNITTKTGAVFNKLTGKGDNVVEPDEELVKMHITKLDDLTLKQLRKIANVYNKVVYIENVENATKETLINELKNHVDVLNGQLVLKDHTFEIMKNKEGTIMIKQEIKRIKGELDELNKRFLPLEKDVKEKRQNIKKDYAEKFGDVDLGDFAQKIKKNSYTVKEINELKKKFGKKTKDDLLYFLEENSFANYKRNNLNIKDKKVYKNLKYNKGKLEEDLKPQNLKEKIETVEKEKIREKIASKIKEIEKNIVEKHMKKFGENLQDVLDHINLLEYTGEKKLKGELQKEYRQKYKIKSNQKLRDFLVDNSPHTELYNNGDYEKLKKEYDFLIEELKKSNYYGLGKMSLKDEFKMDEKDHDKKLSKLEDDEPDDKLIKDTLEGLKSITDSGLKHIEILENMLHKEGGSAKSAGFIRAIMAGKNKEKPNEFKKFNSEGFNELNTKNPINNISSNLIKKNFKNKTYKDFVLFFAVPSGNDLYNNKEMRELYLKDPEKAKNAVESVEEVIYNKNNMEDALIKLNPDFEKLNDEEKSHMRSQYIKAIMSTVLSKYYEEMKPISNEITNDMKARMKASYIKYREKKKMSKKAKENIKDEADEIFKNLKHGQEIEIPRPDKTKKDKKIVEKELIKQVKEDKEEKKILKPKFDYTKPSKEQEEINKALEEREKRLKEKPLSRDEIDTQLKNKLGELKDILAKGKEKKKEKKKVDSLDELLEEYGMTMDDLTF
jgi:hypothetical protein